MKRRLEDNDIKREGNGELQAAGGGGAVMSDDMKEMVAAMIAKELMQNLATASGSRTRFGNVGFEGSEQQNVNAFLHQKLGKGQLTRRPGPGGTRLTYIESCKAIELANKAFGFNGWSCRILECKEEYRTQKGDRWSIGFSSLVKIELKDGTSHEDFGFGQADGQRDLGAAIEQAKKASISDARKRALRLFGEYLGNSCYDREHIKEVHSNRAPMAANAASPAEMAARVTTAMAVSASGVLTAAPPPASAPQHAPSPMQPQSAPTPMQVPNGSAPMQQPRLQQTQTPPRATAYSAPNGSAPMQQQTPPRATAYNNSAPPRHNNSALTSSSFANNNGSAPAHPASAVNGVAARISAMQAVDMNKRQAVASAVHGGPTAATSAGQQQRAYQPNSALQNQPPPTSSSASPFAQGQYPRQPLHTIGMNAPPPTRGVYQPQSLPVIKAETARAQPPVEYDMNDLSLSQFDFEPQR